MSQCSQSIFLHSSFNTNPVLRHCPTALDLGTCKVMLEELPKYTGRTLFPCDSSPKFVEATRITFSTTMQFSQPFRILALNPTPILTLLLGEGRAIHLSPLEPSHHRDGACKFSASPTNVRCYVLPEPRIASAMCSHTSAYSRRVRSKVPIGFL